ncbi:MAG: hypothetical protein WAX04_07590 [Oscillospiraceae bacterium]
MDLFIDLKCLSETIASYNSVIKEIYDTCTKVENLKDQMTNQKWSGDGKDSFLDMLSIWLIQTKGVLAEINRTRDILNNYVSDNANNRKLDCEKFPESY